MIMKPHKCLASYRKHIQAFLEACVVLLADRGQVGI